MKQKIKKIILMGVVLIMGLGLFAGCSNDDYVTDSVIVTIGAEFRDVFLAEEFTIEDFEWDNVESIVYMNWNENASIGFMLIRLKRHGRRRVRNAIRHFETLEFVESASVNGRINHF